MRTTYILIFVLLFYSVVTNLQASEPESTEGISITTTESETNDWTTIKTAPEAYGAIAQTINGPLGDEKLIEIVNEGSISTTRTFKPLQAGQLNFKAKHNQLGVLYIFAQTSDNGGQLLFSIQFTESQGILLEESNRQSTLLSEYTADRWYEFSIDFDNRLGNYGMFSVTIDGTLHGEYEYVKSESTVFDLAQITLGSESSGQTAVSAITDSFFTSPEIMTMATTTVSADLLLLSITLSSTSISSNLENGLIVTASLDGIASVATSSIFDTATITEAETMISSSINEDKDSSVGSFIMDIIDVVIDIFTTEEPAPTTEPIENIPNSIPPLPSEIISTESDISEENANDTITNTPSETSQNELPPEPTIEISNTELINENEVQSSISTDEANNNETTTTEF